MTISTAQGMDTFDGMPILENSDDATFSVSHVRDTHAKENTRHISEKPTVAKDEFIILAKNVRGMADDDRLAELEAELEMVQTWSICILSETWRKNKTNYFETKHRNAFMHVGCEAGRRGVGFW